jgi:hypothetical protein
MAFGSLGTLFVDLLMRTAGFESDMGRAARIAEQKSKEISASTIAIGTAMGEFLKDAVEHIAHAVEALVESQVELDKLHEKTGLSAEALSGLSTAAKLAGVDFEAVRKVSQKVSETMLEAAAGSKEAKNALALFGITAKDTADQALDKVVKLFHDLPDGVDKTGLAVKLFGQRFGTELIPLFDKATDGLAGFEALSKKFGLNLTQKDLDDAREFEESIKALGLVMEGVALSIERDVLPDLKEFVNKLSDPDITSGFKSIAEGAITAFSTVISWAAQAGQAVAELAKNSAAASYGAAQGDIQRENDEVDRIQARIKQIQSWSKSGFGNIALTFTQDAETQQALGGNAFIHPIAPQAQLDFERKRLAEVQAQLAKDNADLARAAAIAAGIDPSKYGVAGGTAATKTDTAATDAAADAKNREGEAAKRLKEFLEASANAHVKHARAAKDDSDEVNKAIESFYEKEKELEDSLDGPAGQAQRKYDKEFENFIQLANKGKLSVEELNKAEGLLIQQLKIADDAIRAHDFGPVTEEANRYAVALDALKKNAVALKYSDAELTQAEALLAKGHELAAKAAQDELDPGAAILRDLTDQLNLTQMNSAAQATFNQLKNLSVEDQKKYHDAVLAANDALERQNKLISLQDSLRGDMANFFDDLMTGSKSAAQAFKDFANSIAADISRLIAQNFAEKLFGQQGQNGGGSFGGIFSSLFNSLLGSGGGGGYGADEEAAVAAVGGWAMGGAFMDGEPIPFARGGIVNSPTLFPMASGMGLMGEAGPEAVMPLKRVNGKLGVVMSGGGGSVVQNFYVNGSVTQKTAAQMRQEEAIQQRRAVGRNAA